MSLCVPGPNFSSFETPETETRELLSTGKEGQWVSIGGLLPYSNYTVLVKACNSQGCVDSSPTSVSLPPGGQYQTQLSVIEQHLHLLCELTRAYMLIMYS